MLETYPATYTEDFVSAYVECGLWAGLDYPEPTASQPDPDPSPFDDKYDATAISPELLAEIREDCEQFIAANRDALIASGLPAEQAGHDFYLTRCGHGTGYWDRGLPEPVSSILTEAAIAYGETYWYAHDGMVDTEYPDA